MPNVKFLASPVPEIWSGPKILKVGHVTPSQPANKGSPVNLYLNSPTPICLFTIQLSWGYHDD